MRATFASRAISAGIGADELARMMGTSVTMIEEHYGILLGSAIDGLRVRLDAYDSAKSPADDVANPHD
jgi:hypothetical protein